jgi:hypothetical protein
MDDNLDIELFDRKTRSSGLFFFFLWADARFKRRPKMAPVAGSMQFDYIETCAYIAHRRLLDPMAAAVAVKEAVTISPSPFATLLRQSKFSAFDPAISQVYTTHGGHAHRGNYGFKRPLAVRSRQNGFITVKSVDSHVQQTEWSSAKRQAKWIQRWDELNTNTVLNSSSAQQWLRADQEEAYKNWENDSEFAPKSSPDRWNELREDEPASISNITSMSPKEFENYLKRLKHLRTSFREFISNIKAEEERKRRGLDPETPLDEAWIQEEKKKTLFEYAQEYRRYHRLFLGDLSRAEQVSQESRTIERRPHTLAGLSYSHTPAMQTKLTTHAQPGLLLGDAQNTSTRSQVYLTTFAGLTNHMTENNKSKEIKPMFYNTRPASFEHLNKAGIASQFRITRSSLIAAPTVVGERMGLKGMKLMTEVRDEKTPDLGVWNRHRLGSYEYTNAALEARPMDTGGRYSVSSWDIRRTVDQRLVRGGATKVSGKSILNTLSSLRMQTPKKAPES